MVSILISSSAWAAPMQCRGSVRVDGLAITGTVWITIASLEPIEARVKDGFFAFAFEYEENVLEPGSCRIGCSRSKNSKCVAVKPDWSQIGSGILELPSIDLPEQDPPIRPLVANTATALQEVPIVRQILIAGRNNDSLLGYDLSSGDYRGPFVGSLAGGLDAPHGVAFGPDGRLYIASNATHSVLCYDGQTGAFQEAFVPSGYAGMENPWDVAFGPEGDLYVSCPSTDRVLRFQGATGALVGFYAHNQYLLSPTGLAFAPDGSLLVCGHVSDNVVRFNRESRAYIDEFIPGKSGGLDGPIGICAGPDGNLHVASTYTDSVLRYDGQTGAFLDAFVAPGSGGLDAPSLGLQFGPDGDLYVSSTGNDQVLRFDGQTGVFLNAAVTAGLGGLSGPRDFVFLQHMDAILTAQIAPEQPQTLDDLICQTSLTDEMEVSSVWSELTGSDNWAYRWFRNGILLDDPAEVDGQPIATSSPILSNRLTTKNETWFCIARYSQDDLYLEAQTQIVTIANSTPSAPVFRFLPEHPTPDTGLAAWIVEESTDADGDDVVYLIEWFESQGGGDWHRRAELSGSPPPYYDQGEPEVSSLYTQAAERWRVTITPLEVPAVKPTTALRSSSEKSVDQDWPQGTRISKEFYIYPDLNGDRSVDQGDLYQLMALWHQTNGDLPEATRRAFFEEGDSAGERIDYRQLFNFIRTGWPPGERD